MKNTRITIAVSLLMMAGSAFATNPPNPCGNHGNNCNPGNNTNGQSQTQEQGQDQGQHQGQTANGGTGVGYGAGGDGGAGGTGGAGGSAVGQGGAGGHASSGSSSGSVSGSASGVNIGDVGSTSGAASTSGVRSDIANSVSNGSTSSASNGDQSLTGTQTVANTNGGNTTASGASADGSGNSQVNVDSSDRSSYSSQALFLPSLPGAAPTYAPGAMATVVAGSCGPLMAVESEDVNGTYLGLLRKHSIPLGRTDRIVPYQGGEYVSRTYPDGSTRLLGHRAVRTVAVLTVAGSRQVSLGGGATGGNYGQGGAGGSSAMQRMVVQIDLEPCEAFYSAPPAPPVIQFSEPRIPRG